MKPLDQWGFMDWFMAAIIVVISKGFVLFLIALWAIVLSDTKTK